MEIIQVLLSSEKVRVDTGDIAVICAFRKQVTNAFQHLRNPAATAVGMRIESWRGLASTVPLFIHGPERCMAQAE